jgi:vancomycin resistance protein VanJ
VTRFFAFVRRLVILLVTLYATGLAVYLLLRFAFGDRFWPLNFFNNFLPFYFLPLLILLPLALILRAKRTSALTLILFAVGLVWIGPRFIPKAQAAPSGQIIRVATFNMWDTRDYGLERKETWMRETAADILLLQEPPPAYEYGRLNDLSDLYPHFVMHPDDIRYNFNVTLARHPIRVDGVVPGVDTPITKRSVVNVNGQEIAVYNVHMPWPSAYPRVPRFLNNFYLRTALGYDDRERDQFIRDLLDILDHEPLPFIVAGDFNASDYSLIYMEMAAQMNDAFAEAGYGLGGSWPNTIFIGFPRYFPPLIRIDYIWHSDHFQTIRAEQGPRLGSDHIPLLADLTLLRPNP